MKIKKSFLVIICLIAIMLVGCGNREYQMWSGRVEALSYDYGGFGAIWRTTVYFDNDSSVTFDDELTLEIGECYKITGYHHWAKNNSNEYTAISVTRCD